MKIRACLLLISLISILLALPTRSLAATSGIETPAFESLERVDTDNAFDGDSASRTFVLRTQEHKPVGDAYIIVTDHTEEQYLAPLRKLAAFHHGKVLQIGSFADLCTNERFRDQLRTGLQAERPRFVAIAPTLGTYQENVLLTFWQIMSELGPEPGLDVFPGLLVAPDAASFANLIEHSITYTPAPIKPFIVAQVTDCGQNGQRSLQKLRILRQYFQARRVPSSGLIVRKAEAMRCQNEFPAQVGEFELDQKRPRVLVPSLTPEIQQAFAWSNLDIFFGHGVPGMTCSLDVNAFDQTDFTGKIVLSGSCFSAAPLYSDLPTDSVGIDGSPVENERTRFFQRAIANGAVILYGHMRTNGGFPELSAFFEGLMNGLTVGESYQRLTNANIAMSKLPQDRIMILPQFINFKQAVTRHNALLYVVIGDPALTPFPNRQN